MNRRHLFSVVASSLVLVIPLSLPSSAGAQATATACGNAPAGYNVIESNARFITGTTGRDFICAGDSNNIIRAKGQDDIIYGRGGNDVIYGGYGNDTIWAGDGNDLVRAGGGKDAVSAGAGTDTVLGGDGADRISGDAGNDKITGGDGHDMVEGGDGADKLVGNKGIDRLEGGRGNDIGQGGVGTDTILGGDGDDVLSGGDSNDLLGGGNGNDRLLGGNGDDKLTGGNGNDALIGGGNQDVLRGSGGNDLLDGGNGLNLAIGGTGTDQCKNVDDPASVCEFIDGIESAAPPARIWLLIPSAESPAAVVAGTNWTPNSDIDVAILGAAGAKVNIRQTVQSDASGDWELVVSSANLVSSTILVGDSAAGREKTLSPVLDSFDWTNSTDDLTIMGTPGATMEAQIFFPGAADDLVFVEQMTMDASGTASANFSEVEEIGVLELRRSDDDGDVEIHSNVTLQPSPSVTVNTPTVQAAVITIAADTAVEPMEDAVDAADDVAAADAAGDVVADAVDPAAEKAVVELPAAG